MSTRSGHDVLEHNIKIMGKELGHLHYYLVGEWCDLHLIWKQFVNLFCSGPERVALLNRCGANFFYTVDRLFFESAVLSVCRLTDPANTFKKANLTVNSYTELLSDERSKAEIVSLLKVLSENTKFARDWRNRHIGHNDLALKLGEAKPLEAATIESMAASIDAILAVINFVQMKFFENTIHNGVIGSLNDEMVTLNRLFYGDEVHQQRLENLRNNIDIPNDEPEWLSNSPRN